MDINRLQEVVAAIFRDFTISREARVVLAGRDHARHTDLRALC
jgi:hypothetical protein